MNKTKTIAGIECEVRDISEMKESCILDIPKNQEFIIEDSDIIAKAVALGISENKAVLIKGPKGTGKTSIIYYIAQQLNIPVTGIQMTGTTSVNDFAGEKGIKNGQTFIEKKTLQKAMEEGYIFIADELNMPLADVLAVLYSVLDDRKTLMIPGGDIEEVPHIKAHKNFRFFATINPSDEGEYMGTKRMSEALIDRFKIVVSSEYPDIKKEVKIINNKSSVKISDETETFIDGRKIESKDGVLTRMCKIAEEIRKSEDISYTLSTRNLIDWAELCSVLSIIEAFNFSFKNKIEDKDDMEAIESIVTKYFLKEEKCKLKQLKK